VRIGAVGDTLHQRIECCAGAGIIGGRAERVEPGPLLQPGVNELDEEVGLEGRAGIEACDVVLQAPDVLDQHGFWPLEGRKEQEGQGFIDNVAARHLTQRSLCPASLYSSRKHSGLGAVFWVGLRLPVEIMLHVVTRDVTADAGAGGPCVPEILRRPGRGGPRIMIPLRFKAVCQPARVGKRICWCVPQVRGGQVCCRWKFKCADARDERLVEEVLELVGADALRSQQSGG
jgi:hypothetical protein